MLGKKINIINKEPYLIFGIENFLDNTFYNKLEDSFNKIKSSGLMDLKTLKKSKKFTFSREMGQNFLNFIRQDETMNSFDNFIYSKEFFEFFKDNILSKIYQYQDNFFRKLKYLRKIKYNLPESPLNIFYSNVQINYSYTIMKNSSYLAPHVDSQKKFLSLLLYFPDKNYDDILCGTTFWKSDQRNTTNLHQYEKDSELFKKNADKIHQSPFKKNYLCGFTRNDFSWHNVEKIKVDEKYERKAITINFIYLN